MTAIAGPRRALGTLQRHPWRLGFGVAVLGIAAIHLGGLDVAPPGLYNDEASVGYNAWAISHHGVDEHGVAYPLFYEAFGEYKGPFSLYPLALLLKVLPLTVDVVRLPSALYGIAAAILVGLTAWRLTRSRPVALLALLTAGLEPWLVVEARTDMEANMGMVLALVAAVWCLSHAGTARAGWWYLGCGVSTGAALFAYTPARAFVLELAVLVMVCFGGVMGIVPAPLRDRRAMVTLGPIAAAYAVLLLWAHNHPGALLARYDVLSITSDNAAPLTVVARFLGNYVQYLGAPFLFTHGDGNLRHNTQFGGMLLLVTAPALIAGLVACARRWREPMPLLTLTGVLAGPVPAALTMDGTPHSLRAATMLPFLLLAEIYGWAVIWPWLSRRRVWLATAGLLVAVECGGYFWDLYVEWPQRSLTWFDAGEGPAIARASQLSEGHPVLISSSFDVPYIQALFYLQPDPDAFAVQGLSVLHMAVMDPSAMAAASGPGDVLVLGPGDQPPPGSSLLFAQSVDLVRHTPQAGVPQDQTVVLADVYRRR